MLSVARRAVVAEPRRGFDAVGDVVRGTSEESLFSLSVSAQLAITLVYARSRTTGVERAPRDNRQLRGCASWYVIARTTRGHLIPAISRLTRWRGD